MGLGSDIALGGTIKTDEGRFQSKMLQDLYTRKQKQQEKDDAELAKMEDMITTNKALLPANVNAAKGLMTDFLNKYHQSGDNINIARDNMLQNVLPAYQNIESQNTNMLEHIKQAQENKTLYNPDTVNGLLNSQTYDELLKYNDPAHGVSIAKTPNGGITFNAPSIAPIDWNKEINFKPQDYTQDAAGAYIQPSTIPGYLEFVTPKHLQEAARNGAINNIIGNNNQKANLLYGKDLTATENLGTDGKPMTPEQFAFSQAANKVDAHAEKSDIVRLGVNSFELAKVKAALAAKASMPNYIAGDVVKNPNPTVQQVPTGLTDMRGVPTPATQTSMNWDRGFQIAPSPANQKKTVTINAVDAYNMNTGKRETGTLSGIPIHAGSGTLSDGKYHNAAIQMFVPDPNSATTSTLDVVPVMAQDARGQMVQTGEMIDTKTGQKVNGNTYIVPVNHDVNEALKPQLASKDGSTIDIYKKLGIKGDAAPKPSVPKSTSPKGSGFNYSTIKVKR